MPSAPPAANAPLDTLFASRGWVAFPFQGEVWQAIANGESGLVHSATGSGKTLAVFGGATLAEPGAGGLRVLWITPMRALAADTEQTLREFAAELRPDWKVGGRTGDTPSAERARQARRLPDVLVTTPESLSLFLARPAAQTLFAEIAVIVVDEWHELVATKRGVQVQLALARLARWRPQVSIWALSATLGNTEAALAALLGPQRRGRVVQGRTDKRWQLDTLIPERIERFPWAGHLGLKLVPKVVAEIEKHASTLVFTNTRSQAELWYRALLEARPDWAGLIALHHGSLDLQTRRWVEAGLKAGSLLAVVATSSLDLGVDFTPVERVLQIGSPKGVARFLQRAGRAGHVPGAVSRATCVPTHAFELIESAAARAAALAGRLEPRLSPECPLDVLVQHLVTLAVGDGFVAAEVEAEVRATWAFRNLAAADWRWALDFASGGGVLAAYPDFHRIVLGVDGRWRVTDPRIARQHRLNIGTIVADAAIEVRFLAGKRLGQVEESFIARLRAGDCFLFAGRTLEFVRVRELVAYVRAAPAGRAAVPRWMGGNLPLSTALADAVRSALQDAREGGMDTPELRAMAPLLELQQRLSVLPASDELLIETLHQRSATHAFIFPFGGRLVHLGLAALIAWRVARQTPATFGIAVNDYGFELAANTRLDWEGLLTDDLFRSEELAADMALALNAAELGKRRFREIARVAGLVMQSAPGLRKSTRQIQASSGLLHDVFVKYDPSNPLLAQARTEALFHELEWDRLVAVLARMRSARRVHVQPGQFTPLAFPLMVETLRERLSGEKLSARLEKLLGEMERKADRVHARAA